MNRRELAERLAAEIQRLSAAGDHDLAGKLVALQLEVVARMRRETIAEQSGDGAAVPPPRPVPAPERTAMLGERHELELLRWHWGSFYEIAVDAAHWTARRRDDGGVLAAASADDLRQVVHEDFAMRPVPRQLSG